MKEDPPHSSDQDTDDEEKIYYWTNGVRDGEFVTWDDPVIDPSA